MVTLPPVDNVPPFGCSVPVDPPECVAVVVSEALPPVASRVLVVPFRPPEGWDPGPEVLVEALPPAAVCPFGTASPLPLVSRRQAVAQKASAKAVRLNGFRPKWMVMAAHLCIARAERQSQRDDGFSATHNGWLVRPFGKPDWWPVLSVAHPIAHRVASADC